MPRTQAKGGFKTFLYRDDGGGTFAAKIAELLDVTGPELSQVVEDATNQDSPSGYVERIATGVRDGGQVSFQMHLLQDDATQNLLYADHANGTLSPYRLVFPSATKRLSFSAVVEKIGHSYPLKGKMVNDVTLSISGVVVKENHP